MVNNRHELICYQPNLHYVDNRTNYSTRAVNPLLSGFTPLLGLSRLNLISLFRLLALCTEQLF